MEGKYFVLIQNKDELTKLYNFLKENNYVITYPEIFNNNVERPFALSIHKDKSRLGYISFCCVAALSTKSENMKFNSINQFIAYVS